MFFDVYTWRPDTMSYVNLPPSTVSSMIRTISRKCLSRIQSDEPSVVGCCFEGTFTVVLQNLTTIMKFIYWISSLLYVPQNDEKFVLNHTVLSCRYNAETIENVSKSLLYHTEKYTPAVDVFMAHRAISMIAFPRVRTIYIYIPVSPTRACVVYVVKEVTSFPGARSINGRGT